MKNKDIFIACNNIRQFLLIETMGIIVKNNPEFSHLKKQMRILLLQPDSNIEKLISNFQWKELFTNEVWKIFLRLALERANIRENQIISAQVEKLTKIFCFKL